jgi:hemerythrin-like domain-containing protein
MKGAEINYEDFNEMIDFIKKYADAHHHGKEEKFLFKEMQSHLGRIGANLITHGMLVEHDYGRMYIGELSDSLLRVKNRDEESKLDVIANAIGYANLLAKHIAKENAAVYSYGAKNLPKEILEDVDKKSEEFETAAEKEGIQKHYISLLEKLENKYL